MVDALEDVKAQDIRVFDTGPQRDAKSPALSDLFDRVVVATATSNRQTRALAAHVQERARDEGYPVVSVEGEETGEWVLVDLGDLIVHIMQPTIRAYYTSRNCGAPIRWNCHCPDQPPGVIRAARLQGPPKDRGPGSLPSDMADGERVSDRGSCSDPCRSRHERACPVATRVPGHGLPCQDLTC